MKTLVTHTFVHKTTGKIWHVHTKPEESAFIAMARELTAFGEDLHGWVLQTNRRQTIRSR